MERLADHKFGIIIKNMTEDIDTTGLYRLDSDDVQPRDLTGRRRTRIRKSLPEQSGPRRPTQLAAEKNPTNPTSNTSLPKDYWRDDVPSPKTMAQEENSDESEITPDLLEKASKL